MTRCPIVRLAKIILGFGPSIRVNRLPITLQWANVNFQKFGVVHRAQKRSYRTF